MNVDLKKGILYFLGAIATGLLGDVFRGFLAFEYALSVMVALFFIISVVYTIRDLIRLMCNPWDN